MVFRNMCWRDGLVSLAQMWASTIGHTDSHVAGLRRLQRDVHPHWPALRKPRKSMNSFIPRPVFAETRSTCIPGRTAWMFASAVGSSKSTASAKSILVSTATSALLVDVVQGTLHLQRIN